MKNLNKVIIFWKLLVPPGPGAPAVRGELAEGAGAARADPGPAQTRGHPQEDQRGRRYVRPDMEK